MNDLSEFVNDLTTYANDLSQYVNDLIEYVNDLSEDRCNRRCKKLWVLSGFVIIHDYGGLDHGLRIQDPGSRIQDLGSKTK